MRALGKINFCVVQVTGEDEDYPASELNVHGPAVKGWQSPRFCHYPQEIVFQLEARCRLSKIQILAHQYLIATKIELYTGDVPKGVAGPSRNIQWLRLGEVIVSDNTVTDYKARELKSVLTDAIGSFLRMVLHHNYINRLNLCNQVGIIAVNVIGDKSSRENDSDVEVRSWRIEKPSVFDDIAFEMYLDKEAQLLIRKLEEKKKLAISEENFDLATKVKDTMVRLQMLGEKLGKLEIDKQLAVDAENYDKARTKKELMDKLRVQSYKNLRVVELLGMCQDFTPKLGSPITELSKPRRLSTPPPKKASPLAPVPVMSPTPPISRKSRQQLRKTAYENYDDMVIPTLRKKNGNQVTNHVPIPIPHPSPPKPIGSNSSSVSPKSGVVLPPTPTRSANKKLPEIASIPDYSKRVFGLPLIEKLVSKSFAQRELASRAILRYLNAYREDRTKYNPSETLRATIAVLQRLLRDKVVSVFSVATEIADYIYAKYLLINRVTREELVESAHSVIEWILARLGDSNPRIKQIAINSLILLSSNRIIQDTNLIPMLVLKPFDNQTNANESEGRCVLVEKILHRFHVQSTPWLSTSSVMTFSSRALEHNSSPVREVAERIILSLYIQVGDSILPLIPEPAGRPPYVHLLRELERLDDQGKASRAEITSVSTSSSLKENNYFDDTDDIDDFCIFCKTRSPRILAEGLDVHFWRDCPMLTKCDNCKMIVEISNLTEHKLGECDARNQTRQCPRCMEAQPATKLAQHFGSGQCIPAKPEYISNRCPLCHLDIPPWDDGWRQHIMERPFCKANPRNHHLTTADTKSRGRTVTSRGPSRRNPL